MGACHSDGFRDEGVYTQQLHEHVTTSPFDDQSITGPLTGLTSFNQVYEQTKEVKWKGGFLTLDPMIFLPVAIVHRFQLFLPCNHHENIQGIYET